MPDDLTRRAVLIGTAAVAGSVVLPATSAPAAAIRPPVPPWPGGNPGCLTAAAAPARAVIREPMMVKIRPVPGLRLASIHEIELFEISPPLKKNAR
jgi:hypothetical protein